MSKSNESVLLSALDNGGGYPFDEVFDHVVPAYGMDDVQGIFEVTNRSALVIWGGADIDPSWYGQKPNHTVWTNDVPSNRDQLEVEMATHAMKLGIPIIGICRGAQLMCALSGGCLVQDVTTHAGGWHQILCQDRREFSCPSLHHQMMFPWPYNDKAPGCEFELIAWATPRRSRHYWGEPNEEGIPVDLEVTVEPEIIYIPATKSLCIQSHPEFVHERGHPFVRYTLELVAQYVATWLNPADYKVEEQAA